MSSIVTAVAKKPPGESKLGISFSRKNVESPLVIDCVQPDGLWASSRLEAGMQVESIMGVPVMFSSRKEATDILRLAEAGSEVVIKAIMVNNASSRRSEIIKAKNNVPAQNHTKEVSAADVICCCCFFVPNTNGFLMQ
jgi:hypothetical protein